MVKDTLAFAAVARLVNNTPGTISPVGEITTQALTYSFSKGEYYDSNTPGYRLLTFSVKDISNAQDVSLSNAEASLILSVTKSIIDYAVAAPVPVDPLDFFDTIRTDHYNDIIDLKFGEMITGAGVTVPSWFSFTTKQGDQNLNKVWLSDLAFRIQYPEYDVQIVPPHPDLSIFQGNWQTAVNALADWTNLDLIQQVQIVAGDNPYTYLRYFEFDFVNRFNTSQKHKTGWYALVYGEAGNFDDIIKDAIIDKLVSTTGQSENQWRDVFPDLFKRTEFVCYPRWDLQSIPNMTTLTGLYSPFINLKQGLDYAAQYASFYTEPFVRDNTISFPVTYKGISLLCVNGENNLSAMSDLKQLWYDYIPVPSSSPDFQRMRPATQEWVDFMLRMIENAETATTVSALPQGMRRIKRGDLWYIASTHERATYFVAVRYNFPELDV